MNKNLEEFIRKDIDILLEDEFLAALLSDFLIAYNDKLDWAEEAFDFADHALKNAEKIVKENEEVGLYDR